MASAATVYTDTAASSAYSDGWQNGDNGGSGFGAWTITASGGSGGFAGAFIGNPNDAGITGMGTQAFGLYANPASSGASVTASRNFFRPLIPGDVFSLQWGINWDGGNTTFGNKGIKLFAGATEVVNVLNGGNASIFVNGTNTGFSYGTTPMIWSFTLTSPTNLQVQANDRDGNGSYSTNIALSSSITSFSLYAQDMASGNNRQPYYNNLSFTAIPEPGAMVPLAALLGGGCLVRRRRA
jgi:hypothetical protein